MQQSVLASQNTGAVPPLPLSRVYQIGPVVARDTADATSRSRYESDPILVPTRDGGLGARVLDEDAVLNERRQPRLVLAEGDAGAVVEAGDADEADPRRPAPSMSPSDPKASVTDLHWHGSVDATISVSFTKHLS